MEILILGTGCYNCLKLEMMVARLFSELDLSETPVTRVDNPRQIREFIPEGTTPDLVINGRLVSSGGLSNEFELRHWLSEASQLEQQNAN